MENQDTEHFVSRKQLNFLIRFFTACEEKPPPRSNRDTEDDFMQKCVVHGVMFCDQL